MKSKVKDILGIVLVVSTVLMLVSEGENTEIGLFLKEAKISIMMFYSDCN